MSRGGGGIPRFRDTDALLSRSWAGRIAPDDGVEPSVALGKAKQGDAFKRSSSVLYSSSKPRGTSVWLDPLRASRRPMEEEKAGGAL